MSGRVSVVVPTYCEADNIRRVATDLHAALEGVDHEILVVDDDSPDGTAERAQTLADDGLPVRVIRRTGERGLASAVVRGFEEAEGSILVVTDADGSHPARTVPRLAEAVEEGAEMALASRYVERGGVEGWPLHRLVISKGATLLAAPLADVEDPMSGFFAIDAELVADVDLDPQGFKIGLEILARADPDEVVEVPYTFHDRRRGDSKLGADAIVAYLRQLFGLLRDVNPPSVQFLKFVSVGGLGALLNLAVFATLVHGLIVPPLAAAAVSFGAAVTFNFTLDKVWTFRDRERAPDRVARQYGAFVAVSLAGLGINLAVLWAILRWTAAPPVLGQAAAIGVASVWNFLGTRRWSLGPDAAQGRPAVSADDVRDEP